MMGYQGRFLKSSHLCFLLPGISYILFETRIGCLEKQIPAETQNFIHAIGYMLKNSIFATILPKWTRDVLPFWNRYLQGWDTIFAFGMSRVGTTLELPVNHPSLSLLRVRRFVI